MPWKWTESAPPSTFGLPEIAGSHLRLASLLLARPENGNIHATLEAIRGIPA